MLNCAVCDDDKNIADSVASVIKTVLGENKCVGNVCSYNDSRLFVSDIMEYKPLDLVVTDIEMPFFNGMQIAVEIKKRFPECCIIFLTSHSKYAIESFELQIFRYARKSDIETKLPMYIKEALTMLTLQDGCVYIVPKSEKCERLPYNQILCIKKDGKYSTIVCIDNREIRIRKPLYNVAKELDSEEFFMIDRSCIVNVAMIIRVAEREVVCKNGVHLPISRSKLTETKTKVALYWGGKL
ncbi:MAG: response regulator transcription factor [Clostridia bacterium]|nr:response regulator transcription factor [Clostridia bacterium]